MKHNTEKATTECINCFWADIMECQYLEYDMPIDNPCRSFRQKQIEERTYTESEVIGLLSDYMIDGTDQYGENPEDPEDFLFGWNRRNKKT